MNMKKSIGWIAHPLGIPVAVCVAFVCTACSTVTERRGFLEPTQFAGMLKPNEQTQRAPARAETTVQTVQLHPGSEELTRHSSITFHLDVSKQPLLVRISAELWQQGTGKKPGLSVNGVAAEEMEFNWPSLRERNYVTFLWDRDGTVGYAYDYQGWLHGTAVMDGQLFKVGDNTIGLNVELDQIKIRNVSAEILYGFDDGDTIYDMRHTTRIEPIPMWEGKK